MTTTPDYAHDIAALRSLIQGLASNLNDLDSFVRTHGDVQDHLVTFSETVTKWQNLQDTQLDGFDARLTQLEDHIIRLHSGWMAGK